MLAVSGHTLRTQTSRTYEDKIGVGPGCYIDQVFGQTWAHWVNAGQLFDRDKQLSALRCLWKYNFVPDVGPFRDKFTRGRWYAAAGDAGLLMCTWPKGGKNPAFKNHWQYMYFNECMSGFEYQAATVSVDGNGDGGPMFYFSPSWLPLVVDGLLRGRCWWYRGSSSCARCSAGCSIGATTARSSY